jgi:hypothetical protein
LTKQNLSQILANITAKNLTQSTPTPVLLNADANIDANINANANANANAIINDSVVFSDQVAFASAAKSIHPDNHNQESNTSNEDGNNSLSSGAEDKNNSNQSAQVQVVSLKIVA